MIKKYNDFDDMLCYAMLQKVTKLIDFYKISYCNIAIILNVFIFVFCLYFETLIFLFNYQKQRGRSMDENYQDDDKNNNAQYSQEQVELNKLIYTILGEASRSNPTFPAQLSKKACEEYGVESSDNIFYNLMSNIVEYSLNDILINVKQARGAGKYKKQGKDLTLKTLDVQKVFESKEIYIAKPRLYPQMSVSDQNVNGTQQKMQKQ